MFEWWRPANLANNLPLVKSISKRYQGAQIDPATTTETGASGTAAPSVWEFSLLASRYERMAIITDIRQLLLQDTRLARFNRKFAREAVREGVVITVQPATAGGNEQSATRAQQIIDKLLLDCHIQEQLLGWAMTALSEGDLYLQRVVAGSEIVAIKRMPADSMERNTDETDSFVDLAVAFTQFDAVTQSDIAQFAQWQITHMRWQLIPGERYGTSEYVQIRGPARQLLLLEQAQIVRRITRAPLRRHHKIGDKEKPAKLTGEGSINEYKSVIGMAGNPKAVQDPLYQITDYFTNANVDIKNLEGDRDVHQIDDLLYFQELLAIGGTVPPALIGLAAKNVNRDVLKDQRAEFLKETVALTELIEGALRQIFDFALQLQGVNPRAVAINIRFSESSMETASERVERIIKLREATVGVGKNAVSIPLISQKTALQSIARDMGISNVDAELDAIAKELDELGLPHLSSPTMPVQQPEVDPREALTDAHRLPEGAPRHRVAVVVVTDQDGRVLVLKRSPGAVHAGEWESPGGHVDPSETPEQAGIREVKEETGLDVAIAPGVAVEFPLRGGGVGVMLRGIVTGGALEVAPDEHDAHLWLDPRRLAMLAPVPPNFLANTRQVLTGGVSDRPEKAKKAS